MATSLKATTIRFSADSTEISSRYYILPKATKTFFNASSAPTGWSQDTNASLNECTLRVVSSSAGSVVTTNRSNFSVIYSSRSFPISGSGGSVSGFSIGGTTLSSTQIPGHTHPYSGSNNVGSDSPFAPSPKLTNASNASTPGSFTGPNGANNPHTHSLNAGSLSATDSQALNFSIKYTNLVLCSLD
jgi:hypothetical protein